MNVLLAVDDSEPSRVALEAVRSRAWSNDTQLRVLCVAPVMLGMSVTGVPVAGSPGTASPVLSAGQLDAQKVLVDRARTLAEGTCASLRDLLRCEPRWRQGTPGVEIVHEARAWPADLIVLGSRGYGAIKSALLGSVATYVLHHAPCSVEVVRERAHEDAFASDEVLSAENNPALGDRGTD